jgi:hypothetical protein
MVDYKDFLRNFLLNQFFAVLIPHRAVNIIVEFCDDSDCNKVEHDYNRVQRSDNDADVANFGGCGDSEVEERDHEGNLGSFKVVTMVEHVLHVHERRIDLFNQTQMQYGSADKTRKNYCAGIQHVIEVRLFAVDQLDHNFNNQDHLANPG